MKNRIWVLLLGLQCFAIAASAQIPAKRQVVLTISNGGFVAFKSETTVVDNQQLAETRSLASLIYSQALTGENHIVHRVLTDAEQHVIFGYDLWINSDPLTKKFTLGVLPADEAFRRTFLKESAQRTTDAFATFPKSASLQTLDDGDAVSLELLVNKESGIKIVDVVRVTFDRARLPDSLVEPAPKDFTLDAVALSVKGYELFMDGRLVGKSKSTIKCSGSLLWLYVPGRGRFIFSLRPRDGYPFQKVGRLDDDRIEFMIEGERYEWHSTLPILPDGGIWNLWVLQDPNYTPLFSSEKPLPNTPNTSGVFQKLDQVTKSLNLGGGDQRKFKIDDPAPSQKMPGTGPKSNQIEIPQRVMIGAADNIENLLPKSP
ncbi:MAG TPA: hypothetical protein VKB46_19040 [Pyrinomonadaceae bacterium]|nr:hypothetical protein [Pyrinomonadaceae bacterium]